MIQLRIVAPPPSGAKALALLEGADAAVNVVYLPNAARKPDGDVIIADVTREEASVILADLRELGIHRDGSISMERIEGQLSAIADAAEEASPGLPSDAVVWEEVEQRTSEDAELSASYIAFMILATLIASVGIFLDSALLIIGAMIVGPEFGPIAGVCVAVVSRRRKLAARSAVALAIGFPIGIAVTFVAALIFKWTGITPETFTEADHTFSNTFAKPDFFSFFVAFCAGVAGMLSLTSAKSGALVGVLVSVTTIPAAANIAVAAAYGDWPAWRGSVAQLAINLVCILVARVLTLGLQRALYGRRRRQHLGDPNRTAAGLPPR